MEDDSLAEAFWAVARRLRHRTRETLSPWDVTPSMSRAIDVLMRHGESRLNVLAEHLRIAARSATEVVDDLQARELAGRRPDPADRRATLVTLTPGGVLVGTAIRAARQAEAERFFGTLSDADRADLSRILQTLRD